MLKIHADIGEINDELIADAVQANINCQFFYTEENELKVLSFQRGSALFEMALRIPEA